MLMVPGPVLERWREKEIEKERERESERDIVQNGYKDIKFGIMDHHM